QGIGSSTAHLFTSQRDHVTSSFSASTHPSSPKHTARSHSPAGKTTAHVCNLTDESTVRDTIAWIIDAFGKIHVLAHIAGIYPAHDIAEFPTETYRAVMSVNVDAAFFLTRAVIPDMRAAGYGRIIHTSSGTIQEPEAGLSVYVASKAVVVGLVRAVACETGPGITVNAIVPGLIKTERVWGGSVQADGPNPLFESLLRKQLVKRWERPEDIALAFCFVASPEAAFLRDRFLNVVGEGDVSVDC
ncbi:hypothetical protein BJX76DRAFT_359159, partial [Aspergillus varians]